MSSRTDFRYQLIHLEEVDSTQKYALANLEDFATATLITCTRQLAGYGRQKSKWLDSQKNLAFTFVFEYETSLNQIHKLALYLAKALNQTLQSYGLVTKIKWPNDIYGKKKIAGILIDYCEGKVVAGIGINLGEDFVEFEKTNLAIDKNQLAQIIATNILSTLAEEFAQVLQYCNEYSYLYDREVTVKNFGLIKIKELDAKGNLHFIQDDQEKTINLTVFSLKK